MKKKRVHLGDTNVRDVPEKGIHVLRYLAEAKTWRACIPLLLYYKVVEMWMSEQIN